jgi:methyl-accepting chemotaxis protein
MMEEINLFKNKELNNQNELLQQRISQLEKELSNKDSEVELFLNEFYLDLLSTIEQHEVVNGQHGALGGLVGKIVEGFQKMNESSKNANDISDEMIKKGEELINSSKEMVTYSQSGKDAVSRVQVLINSLGETTNASSQSMSELSARSKEIQEIVTVIDKIASQTNLLALNASIEAARAGEQGKGFAVVADEVRKLAENTARSTKGIAEITNRIQEEIINAHKKSQENIILVTEGVKLSADTTNRIDEILLKINSVESEIHNLLNSIEGQQSINQEVLSEFIETSDVFSLVNNALTQHIDDAELVDKKLEFGVNGIKGFLDKNK